MAALQVVLSGLLGRIDSPPGFPNIHTPQDCANWQKKVLRPGRRFQRW